MKKIATFLACVLSVTALAEEITVMIYGEDAAQIWQTLPDDSIETDHGWTFKHNDEWKCRQELNTDNRQWRYECERLK